MEMEKFAYHKTHQHGPFQGTHYITKSPRAKVGSIVHIISGDKSDRPGDGYLYYYEGKYTVIKANRERVELQPIFVPENKILLNDKAIFDKNYFHNQFTSRQSFNPVPLEYLKLFHSFVTSFEQVEEFLSEDINKILLDSISDTERDAQIKARIGQGEFRKNVISTWGGEEQCIVTLVGIKEMLVASHIIPWRNCISKDQRLDGANGLILCSHIDKLFDANLVSFKKSRKNFRLEISKRLNSDVKMLSQLGIDAGTEITTNHLDLTTFSRFDQHMSEHYRRFSENQ